MKRLGLIDLTPLRTFTRPELLAFQAALRSCGGVQTRTERVIDRVITRRWRKDELRRPRAGRRAWAGAARAPETSTWIIAVMLVAVEILATVVWAFVL